MTNPTQSSCASRQHRANQLLASVPIQHVIVWTNQTRFLIKTSGRRQGHCWYVTLIFLLLFVSCDSGQVPCASGLEDVDQINQELATIPTSAVNYAERRATLFRWWRLMWRQGIDLDDFDSLASIFVDDARREQKNFKAIDVGYQMLQEISCQPTFIAEVASQGGPSAVAAEATDWPFFFGTEVSRRGFSPDPGPQKGQVAWKYPKGHYWDASPILLDGKVYISSPGIDVVGFCLEEASGDVLWRGKQNGIHFYGEATSRWSPVVTDEFVSIRGGYDSSTFRVFDRQSGKSMQPNSNAVVPYFRKGANLVLAEASTGRDVWTYESDDYFEGEPIHLGDDIFTISSKGTLSKFSTSSHQPTWQVEVGEACGGSLAATEDALIVGTASSKVIKLSVSDGSVAWTFDAGVAEGRSRQFYSDALIAGGKVYIGGADKKLYCLDANTGDKRWELPLSDWIRSKPVKAQGAVYVATLDGWVHKISDSSDPKVESSRLVSGHGITTDLVKSDKGLFAIGRDLMIYCLDFDLGTRWSRGIVDGAWVDDQFFFADWSGGLLGSPTVVDGIAYIGGPDGFLNAVDAQTGAELWRFETKSTLSIAPTVAEGKVFFGYLGATTEHYGFDLPGEYYAVDSKTGELVWKSQAYGKVWVGAAYHDGVLFFGNTDGHVFAVDPGTGVQRWSYFTGEGTEKAKLPEDTPFTHGFPMGVYCVPTFDEEYVYTGSWSGSYFALDQKTGAVRWRCETKGSDWGGLPDSAAPTLWKDHLYVQKKGGFLAAINRRTGAIDWEWQSPAGYLYNATPAAHADRIYGAVTRKVTMLPYDGELVAFSDVANGGEVLWKKKDMGGLTAPVLTPDQLITGSSNGMFITSLDPATGDTNWKVFTGGEMLENVPAIYGDKLYALCKNGYLFAIE